MPIYKANTVGVDFDGLTPETGLFDPGILSPSVQVLVSSYCLVVAGGIIQTDMTLVDPLTGAEDLIHLSSTTYLCANPTGILRLAVNDDGSSWTLRATTTGLIGSAELSIDYDFVGRSIT